MSANVVILVVGVIPGDGRQRAEDKKVKKKSHATNCNQAAPDGFRMVFLMKNRRKQKNENRNRLSAPFFLELSLGVLYGLMMSTGRFGKKTVDRAGPTERGKEKKNL